MKNTLFRARVIYGDFIDDENVNVISDAPKSSRPKVFQFIYGETSVGITYYDNPVVKKEFDNFFKKFKSGEDYIIMSIKDEFENGITMHIVNGFLTIHMTSLLNNMSIKNVARDVYEKSFKYVSDYLDQQDYC